MSGKIIFNYRRDDARDTAARLRLRDRLAATFGGASVFMDVDNLLAGLAALTAATGLLMEAR
jgi:hypothetical protein